MREIDQIAFHFGTTAQNIYMRPRTFFEIVAVFTGTDVEPQIRKRWLRCLFCLGARPGNAFIRHVDAFFQCSFEELEAFSPQLRSLACGLPDELSLHLHEHPTWRLLPAERAKWDFYYKQTWCRRTRWLARVALSPWNTRLYIRQPIRTRDRATFIAWCCLKAGLWRRPVVLKVLYFADYLK